MRARTAILAGYLATIGCAPPIPDGGFNSPDPASRAYAVIQLVRDYRGPNATNEGTPPARDLEPMVTMLDSADPMNRFLASQALRELTGENLGYDPAAAFPIRALAARRWQAWVDDLRNRETTKPEPRTT